MTRLDSIDTLRAVGAAAVVYIHLSPFRDSVHEGTAPRLVAELLNLPCRFAVPFFFTAAGYFFALKLGRGAAPLVHLRHSVRRLAALFLFWSACGILVPASLKAAYRLDVTSLGTSVREQVSSLAAHPATSLLQGPQEHLWFLPALVISLTLLAVGRQLRVPTGVMLASGAVLYGAALAGGAYRETALGVGLPVHPRNGPMIGLLFVTAGAWLAERRRPSASWALALTVSGLCLSTIEALVLWRITGAPLSSHDALVGTVALGVGAFSFALARPSLGAGTVLPALGTLALGIYAAHMLVALPLSAIRGPVPPVAQEVLLGPAVFVSSALLAWLASRHTSLRRFVT